IKQTGSVIEGNTFESCEGWGLLIYGIDHSRVDYNAFIDCYQGNHILNPGDDFSHSFNYFRGMIRMGSEIQTLPGGPYHRNNRFIGNVAHAWRQYFHDSFAFSWIMDRGEGLVI